jgi:foldase protein PrsA
MGFKNGMTAILSIVIVVGMVLTGCSTLSRSEYVASINGEKVSVEEYKVYLWRIKQVYQSIGQEDIWETKFDGKPAEEVAKERALDSIKAIKLQVEEAKKMKLTLTEEEKEQVKNQAAILKSEIGEEEIKNMGISNSTIEKITEDNIISQKLFETITKDFVGNKEEFEAFFEQNKESLKQIRVKHILFKTHDLKDGKLTALPEEEQNVAKQRAEEALQKAKAGEDFVSLVHEYSQDEASLPSDGEYVFGRNQGMDTEFENAAFELKVNQISDLVKTSYGYHIIKLEEEIQADKESTEKSYYDLEKQSFYQSKIQEWINQGTIEINEEVWKTIKIK